MKEKIILMQMKKVFFTPALVRDGISICFQDIPS